MIYTFYSFKGGVGRSMALANIAELLYNRGLKVLMIDFDLEAPGLERYFGVDNARYKPDEVINKRGVIDLLTSYKDLRSLPLPAVSQSGASTTGEKSFPYPVEPVTNFIVPIYETSRNGGLLSIMPPGGAPGMNLRVMPTGCDLSTGMISMPIGMGNCFLNGFEKR